MAERLDLWMLPSLAVSLVLVFSFHRAWRTSGERYLAIWAMAYTFWALRYTLGTARPFVPEPAWAWILPTLVYVRATLFLWGGGEMVDRRVPNWWWPVLAVAATWAFVVPLDAGPWRVVPTYWVFAVGVLWVAFALASSERFPRLERHLAAWPMGLYGAMQLSFPWRHTALQGAAPVMYLVTSVTQFAFVIGILVIHYRTAEVRLAEHHRALGVALRRALAGHLTVCSGCYSIRGDEGRWASPEQYVKTRSGTRFSHGICPECVEEHYGL